MSVQGDISARMLEVDYIAITKRGNLDPVNPAIGRRIDRLALDSAKFVIQSGVKVVGPELGEIT